MLTCPDCQAAAERPHHGFARLCGGCQARMVARSDAFLELQALLRRCGLEMPAVLAAYEADAWVAPC